MAKLTPGALQAPVTPTPTLPQPVAGNSPFAVVQPSAAKTLKMKRPASQKVPRLKGKAWFDENFSGLATDVVQVQVFPNRKEGFHCPGCGIAGSHAIVIKGKDNRGEDIQIYEPQADRTMKVIGTIKGWMVGETCLRKYGGVDLRKLAAPAA